MKFNVNQQDLQQALNYCQGVIEKRSTLPILSNILLDASNSKLTITATDLDLIFIHQLNNVEILEEGKTTTTSSIMYDIIRKLTSGKKINLTLTDVSKLQVESEKSIFNLNCISATEFPLTDENFNENEFIIKSKQLLKLLNKCKFSVSNDETRHYLSGIYFHQTEVEDKNYLTAVATDSHRMSISKIRLDEKIEFDPIILPKKTIFQLCSLLDSYDGDVKVSNLKSKIKFELNNSILISNQNHEVHHDSYNLNNLNQNYDVNLMACHPVAGQILSNLQGCVDNYLNTFSLLGENRFLLTDVKLKKIPEGGGFHNWHFENASYGTSHRYFVVQVYLNDDFDGGETQFLHQGLLEKPVAGDVLIFPCGYTHVHRGNPPLGGVKYLATSWGWIQP